MATFWTLGCDADDPQRIAAFWALALGYVKESGFDEPDNASIVDPDGRGPAIGFLKVPEGKSGKNRMHIDIRVAGPGPWDMTERARCSGFTGWWQVRQAPVQVARSRCSSRMTV
ncbi:VOC family protein [Micromonospora sp. IBSANI012]|uniref:VOC family protein n=1 Tax=Micromonospora sp. IBSANI012 TaxID=3457761 RepID=UPI00405A1208